MTAEQVIAQHRKLWRDTVAACSGCDWTRFGNLTRTDLAHAAHVLDVLKAAGYAVVALPEPNYAPQFPTEWSSATDPTDEWDVWLDGRRNVQVRTQGYATAQGARNLAGALLAAADAVEAANGDAPQARLISPQTNQRPFPGVPGPVGDESTRRTP